MGALKNHGIVKHDGLNMVKTFESLFPEQTFMDIQYDTPKDYINKYWAAFKSQNKDASVNINGKIFELIIYTLLYRENIRPFYTQAKVAFVPNVDFDTILFNKSAPISLSLKTSLRERYKQADLEAIALKYVHRRAKSYLLTLNSNEAKVVKNKIKEGEVMGLDSVIDCTTNEINDLISSLKAIDFEESYQIDVVSGFVIK